jgi:hypothetical protein
MIVAFTTRTILWIALVLVVIVALRGALRDWFRH